MNTGHGSKEKLSGSFSFLLWWKSLVKNMFPTRLFFPLCQRSGLGILSSIPGVCKCVYLPLRIRRGVRRACVCQSYTSEEQTSRHLAKTSSYIERKDKH